jgi:hypothetical protein
MLLCLVVSTSDEVHVNGRCGEAVRHQSLGTRSISSQSECKDDGDLPTPCISPRNIPAHASGTAVYSAFGNLARNVFLSIDSIYPHVFDDTF